MSTPAKDRILLLGQSVKNELSPLKIHVSILGKVASHVGDVISPDSDQSINSIFADLEARKVRKKVVTNESNKKYEIVDGRFK